MLKSTKLEIKKEHQVLMVDKITSFKKRAKKKNLVLSLRLSASAAKGLVTGSENALNIWWIRRMAR